MPWRETAPMKERMLFVTEWEREVYSMVELCERYGVSRKTGYKWLARYAREGPDGLREQSLARGAGPRRANASQGSGPAGPLEPGVRRLTESDPILRREPRHPREVPGIVRDERQPQRQRMSGHEGVERADRLATPGQSDGDRGKPTGGGLIEGHDFDGVDEGADQAVKPP